MSDQFLSWVGAGIFAVGVSAAVLTGAGSAAADDGSTASPRGDSASESTGTSRPAAKDASERDKPASGATAPDSDASATDGQTAGGAHKPDHTASDKATVKPGSKAGDQAGNDDESASAATSDDVSDNGEGAQLLDEKAPSPTNSRHELQPGTPDVEPIKAASVHSAPSPTSTRNNTPDGATGPQTPAAARPEIRLDPAPSSTTPAGTLTTTDVGPAAVANSLTYTPGPNLFDQITLFSFEVLRAIRVVTGIDLFAIGNALSSSEYPPYYFTFGLQTRRSEYTTADDTTWDVWEFRPPNPTDKTVVTVHGGGFTFEPNITAWLNYTNMARDTGATVIVPLYTLATTEAGRATKVIPDMADFISTQIGLHGADNVSLYGDSAGTILAIGAVRQLLLAGKPIPARMVLLSLAAAPNRVNPDARKVNDPIFDIDKINDAYSGHFFDGIGEQDPLVSALFFEPEVLKALPPTTVYMAEREVTYPDALLLHQRAVDEGAPITMIIGTGLLHDWPLLSGLPFFSQNVVARPAIYRQLGLVDDAATTVGQEFVPNTRLSLDGRTKPRQSIGQHVSTG